MWQKLSQNILLANLAIKNDFDAKKLIFTYMLVFTRVQIDVVAEVFQLYSHHILWHRTGVTVFV
jgi:hypothetical protein